MSKYYLLLLSLVVSLVSYGVEIDPGYYYISSARSGNNAVYVGNPEIPSVFEGSVDNSDPNRGCWTYNKGWEMPEYVTTENTKYLFKISLSDAGNYYIENVGTGRYMGAETRHFHNIITTTTPDEEFEIYACDGCDDHFIIHPLSTEEVWHAAHDCNGLVMWNDTDDEGSHWVLTKIANPEHVISFEQVMVGAKYTIRCPRGALTVNEGHSALQSEYNRGVSFNPNNTDYQFKFLQSDNGDLYLYSVGADKYVVPTGALVASMEDATPIYFRTWSGTNTCQLYWDSGHNLNFGGGKQVAIDTWKDEDDGNRFSIDMQVDELLTYVAQVINNPAGGIIYNSQTYTDAQSFEAKNVELSEIEAVPVEGYATRVTINWDGSRYLITVNYIAVDEDLPSEDKVATIGSREESAIVPGKWYVMTQIRGGETPVYDAGDGQTMRREVAANTVETLFPGTVANNSKYMVRFLSTTNENGYNIQFANGNYWSHMSTSSSATDAMYYMVHPATQTTAGAPSANGWALIWTPDFVNYGSRVDNNAAGGTMSYWQSGDYTSGQNNVFYLYNVDFVTEIQYTVHINNEAGSVEINGETYTDGDSFTVTAAIAEHDVQANDVPGYGAIITINGSDITVTYQPLVTYTVSIVGSEEGSLIYDGQTYTNEQTFTVSALNESLLSAGEVEGKQTIISIEDGVITITYVGPDWTDQGTLKFSPAMTEEGEFAEGTVFYTIQNKSNSRYLRSDSKSGDNLAFATLTEDGYSRWAILGNATDGFQFVNKETKEAIALEKFSGPELTSSNLSNASVSYLTDDLNDESTRFAITTHFKEDNYWVITAADNHYYYWNMLSGKLGYWYSGKGYEYGYYGWDRNASNGIGDPGSSFRFTEVETLETINYTLTITGVENGSITVGDDTYTDGAEFSHLGTLTEDQIIPETVEGYTVAVVINGTDITVYYKTPITYNIYFGDDLLYSEVHDEIIGTETTYAPSVPDYVTATVPTTVEGRNVNVQTAYNSNMPFVPGDDHYYTLKEKRNATGLSIYVDPADETSLKTIAGTEVTFDNQDFFQWSFVGNWYTGYALLNKQTKSYVTYNSVNPTDNYHAVLTETPAEGAYFDLVQNGGENYLKIHGTTNNAYISNYGGIGTTFLTNWNSAANIGDDGAKIAIEEAVQLTYADQYVAALNAAQTELTGAANIPALYSTQAIADAQAAAEAITFDVNDQASVDQAICELDGVMDTFRATAVGSQVAFLSKGSFSTRGADYYLTAGNTNSDRMTAELTMQPGSVFVVESYDAESNGYTVKNVFTEGYLPKLNNIPFNTKFGTSSEEEAGHYTITVQNEEVNLVFLQNTESSVANDRGGIHLDDRLDIVVWGNTGNGSRWILIPVSDEEYADLVNFDVTISQVGYTTLYCDYALEVPEGVKAYAVTFNEETGNLTPAELTEGEIPANTGVVVKGDASTTAHFTRVATTEVSASSDLQGVCQTTEASTVGDNIYVLSATKVSEGVYGNVGFYKFVGANLAAYKAYFIPSNGAEVRAFAIDFGTEGIIDITTGERVEGSFDLQGRPVSKNAKSGLYIIGGKKMMKK